MLYQPYIDCWEVKIGNYNTYFGLSAVRANQLIDILLFTYGDYTPPTIYWRNTVSREWKTA